MIKSKQIKRYAIPLLCGISFFILMRYVFFFGYVPTDSMAPTILAKSYVFGTRIYDNPQKGDIIVFDYEGAALVKRIVALPGETVYIDDKPQEKFRDFDVVRVMTVPENNYYVLGDNAEHSIDSRVWTDPFISGDRIIAKLWRK